ncbi:MAG: hypothetical protein Q8P44_07060 [Dehalococcoidia bacterium]|nr:hypothetical protein [Dehalococcoidia bacterium]
MRHENEVWWGQKIIGHIDGKKFEKVVQGSKHMLKKPPAWCIDADAFDNEILPTCTEIIVRDTESGVEYYSTMFNFEQYKGTIDRGFGRQYFLTLNHWLQR